MPHDISAPLSNEERSFISRANSEPPKGATAALVLEDGSVFWGHGIGHEGTAVGELCFNTSMTGYQEILTDPSYAGQIITFTTPHIGNVGTNPEDIETTTPAARQLEGSVSTSRSTQPRAAGVVDSMSSGWRNDWIGRLISSERGCPSTSLKAGLMRLK